jgi:hypothetical protein
MLPLLLLLLLPSLSFSSPPCVHLLRSHENDPIATGAYKSTYIFDGESTRTQGLSDEVTRWLSTLEVPLSLPDVVVKRPRIGALDYVRERTMRTATEGGEVVAEDEAQVDKDPSSATAAVRQLQAMWQLECTSAAGTGGISSLMPHCLGTCTEWPLLSSYWPRLRPFSDLAYDPELTARQRLTAAASLFRLVGRMAALPPFPYSRSLALSRAPSVSTDAATSIVYGDIDPKQFGIDPLGGAYLLDGDVREFVGLADGQRFGSDVPCTTDEQCHDYLGLYGIANRLMKKAYRRVVPLADDFGCDTTVGRCRGLDATVNIFTFCTVLVRPLLIDIPLALHGKDALLSVPIAALTALEACGEPDPRERWSAARLAAAFDDARHELFGAPDAHAHIPMATFSTGDEELHRLNQAMLAAVKNRTALPGF